MFCLILLYYVVIQDENLFPDLKLTSSVLKLKKALSANCVWVAGEEELILCFFLYETKKHQILSFSLQPFFQRSGIEYP